jgi:FKBP-type peptidyl-prolyl cis-trans isomerase (trigger factor)
MEEFPIVKTMFAGKKDKEEFTTDYNEKDFPPMLHNRNKDGKKAAKVVCTISDVREVVLPDFSAENIKKFFGNDDVTTEEQLRVKITELISKQKREMLLMQAVDGMLTRSAGSFEIVVPKTLIDEEKKTRMKSLEERMGGADGMKQYFEKIGEEEGKKMHTEIETAAKQSLEKFFLLKEIVEKL